MRRLRVLPSWAVAIACAAALVVSGCGPEPTGSGLTPLDRPSATASTDGSPSVPGATSLATWFPVQDPDTSVWFAMPGRPLRQRSDRVTSSGAHLLANQYHSLYRVEVFSEPVAVIVTPYRVVGGSPTDARTVFQGMRDSVVSNGAHGVRLVRVHTHRIDGKQALLATLRFTTKDRKAQGYWRLAQLTGPDYAVLLQVQVSAPRLTKRLIRDGDAAMQELMGSLRVP